MRRASSSVDINAAEWPAMSLSRKMGGDFIRQPARSEATLNGLLRQRRNDDGAGRRRRRGGRRRELANIGLLGRGRRRRGLLGLLRRRRGGSLGRRLGAGAHLLE